MSCCVCWPGVRRRAFQGRAGADAGRGAGVAFVRLESDPDPVRVRAGWVSDADIRDLAAACLPELEPAEPIGWPEVAA